MQPGLDRRSFLQALGAASLAGCSSAPESRAGERPNIVLIMADDMGFSDIGSYGGEISTPNLDALAANGLRFRQFYNAARCCPTRASLLTGLYAHQAGVGHMVGDYGHPSYQGRLNESCVTIAEVLKDAGYTTLMSGKWHVGESRPHWPVDRGFDEYFGLISGGSNYFKLDGARQMATGNDPYTPPDDGSFYMTDAFSDNAVRFLEEHGAKPDPFFLYLPYTAPHWPLHAKPEDIEKYVGKYGMGWDVLRQQRFARQQETGIRAETWTLSPRDPDVPAWDDAQDKALWERRMAVYAAMIDCMDQGIGRVVETIRNLGKLDNTLIMFLADNGGCHENADIEQGTPRNTWGDPNAMPGDAGSFDGYDRPWANASNTPFRMFKSWVHEGGISSPLVCHWPDGIKLPGGSITDAPGHVIDLMATCIDLAEAEYPAERDGRRIVPLEGKSLRPILETGTREAHEALYWEHQGNRAIRQGRWKLVALRDRNPQAAKPWELYDIAEDRSEQHDLAADMPERVAAMEAAWLEWGEKVGWVPFEQLR
ncbi:MAG: arylsulfatase [Acidobacteriia bacterium]|nr:arylsulfatase [Terriglobia bacterium]